MADNGSLPPIRCARCNAPVRRTFLEYDLSGDCWRLTVFCHGARDRMTLPNGVDWSAEEADQWRRIGAGLVEGLAFADEARLLPPVAATGGAP